LATPERPLKWKTAMQNISQKFFLYARKSTDVEDKQMRSIPDQLLELREYAKQQGINIVEELTEAKTAKLPGRGVFNSMLSRVEAGEAEGIVAWHPDRLARNSVDGGKIIYLLDIGKLKDLKFPQHWFENTPQGKFSLNMAFCQSKYFVDSLSENTKRGIRQKVKRGEKPGLAPIGYRNVIINNRKIIVVDKKRAPIIKQAFEMFSTGKYRILDICNFLAKNGIVGRSGKPWKIDRVSKQILSNPFYYGHFKYLGEIHEGVHEPIITKKLWDLVHEVWKKRSHSWKEETLRPIKPLTGLFRCGECGMMITAEEKTKYYPGTNRYATYTYRFAKNYLSHYSPRFLFIVGDEIARSKVPGLGQAYLFTFPFFILGLLLMLSRNDRGEKLILSWLLIAPVAAALTFQSPHALRAQNMVYSLTLITAAGVYQVFAFIFSKTGKKFAVGLCLFTLIIGGYELARYLHQYYLHYPKELPYAWQYGFAQIAAYTQEHEAEYDKIIISDRYDQPYILMAFFTKYPPEKFQQEIVLEPRDKFGFSTVRKFGKYEFRRIDYGQDEKIKNVLIIAADEPVDNNDIIYHLKDPAGRVMWRFATP